MELCLDLDCEMDLDLLLDLDLDLLLDLDLDLLLDLDLDLDLLLDADPLLGVALEVVEGLGILNSLLVLNRRRPLDLCFCLYREITVSRFGIFIGDLDLVIIFDFISVK